MLLGYHNNQVSVLLAICTLCHRLSVTPDLIAYNQILNFESRAGETKQLLLLRNRSHLNFVGNLPMFIITIQILNSVLRLRGHEVTLNQLTNYL